MLRLRSQSLLVTGTADLVVDLADLQGVDEAGRDVLRYVRRIFDIAGGTVTFIGASLDLESALASLGALDLLAWEPVTSDVA